MTRENKKNFIINIIFYAFVFIMLYFSLKFLYVYLFPLIIGLLVTVLVQRPANSISKKICLKKGIVALILVVMTYLLIITALVFLVFKFGTFLGDSLIGYEQKSKEIIDLMGGIIEKIPDAIKTPVNDIFNSIVSGITKYITSIAKNTAGIMPMFFTSTIVTVIASCYIAKDFDGFKASLNSVLKPKHKKVIIEFKKLMSESIFKIIKGYSIIVLITFLELSIGLLLFKIKNPFAVAAIISVIDILPILGIGIVLLPWGVLEIFKMNYFLGVGLIVLYLVILIIRNIIEPKIIGKQIGLHPLFMLLAVFVGLRVFGFIGIIALPLGLMIVWKMYERGIFDILLTKE